MLKTILNSVRHFFAPTSFGVMVINGCYYKPMATKKNSLIDPGMSDEKYLEICDQIRRHN